MFVSWSVGRLVGWLVWKRMNQDEGEKCLKISKDYLEKEKNLEKALRFAQKAYRMNPTTETQEWLAKLQQDHPVRYTSEQTNLVKQFRQRVGDNSNDFYQILDLKRNCSEGEIKKAYRKLACIFHPDKNGAPGAEDCFKQISKAFSVLSNEQKRKQYDLYGNSPNYSSTSSMEEQFSRRRTGARYSTMSFNNRGFEFENDFDAEELFKIFFGSFNDRNRRTVFTSRQQQSTSDHSNNNTIFSVKGIKVWLPVIFVLLWTFFMNWSNTKKNREITNKFVHEHVRFDDSFQSQFPYKHSTSSTTGRIEFSYWSDEIFNRHVFWEDWYGRKKIRDLSSYNNYFKPAILTFYIKYLQDKCKEEKEIQLQRVKEAISQNDQQLANQIQKEKLKWCQRLFQMG